MKTPSILFVCLGNICRSPLAEAALRHRLQRAGLDWRVDSAGTSGAHSGEPPDARAQAVAAANGLSIATYRGRRVQQADFVDFTHIVALDRDNLATLRRIAPAETTATLTLLLDYVPGMEGQSVADPYYGDAEGFNATWRQVDAAAEALIARYRLADR